MQLSALLEQRGAYSDETVLAVVEMRADELSQWAEIMHTLFEMIKLKYWDCYSLLHEYIATIFCADFQLELELL